MVANQPRVTRIQPFQDLLVAHLQILGCRAERLTTDMGYEHARRGDMPPTQMARAKAEVILLPIALGEYIGAQQANRIEAVPA